MHNKTIFLLIVGATLLWTGVHGPAIFYGTTVTPLHVSYWSADEQSPVNGALHMLKEKSILGTRNENTLYYGPVFALLALPPVLADYAVTYIVGTARGADAYKDAIVWDWGGILEWARLASVIVGFIGLVAVFFLFRTGTVNPEKVAWLPYAASGMLALTYFYFEYASFFRHWIFVTVLLLWQIVLLVWTMEKRFPPLVLWSTQVVLTIAAFGISYVSMIYQIFWLPVLFVWFFRRDWVTLRHFLTFGCGVLVLAALIVWWHPYAVIRYFGMVGLIETTGMAWETVVPMAGHSYIFYLKLLLLHTWPALLILLYLLSRFGSSRNAYIVYAFVTPILINFAVFGWQVHHETRYMVPTIVLIVVLAIVLCAQNYASIFLDTRTRRATVALASIYLVFNLATIVGWSRMVLAGPVERSEIIPQIQAWQEENSEARILMIKSWPLGWVHTPEAYADYIDRYDKSKYEMWQYLRTLEPPPDITPLNVYYMHEGEDVTAQMVSQYDHVVRHVLPAVGQDIASVSPQDEFDIRPWNVWRYKDFQERYEIIK